MRAAGGSINLQTMIFLRASQRARSVCRTTSLLLWALAGALPGQPLQAGEWLLGPTLAAGATRIGPTPDRGQIGTGTLINGQLDGAIPDQAAWDSSAGAGLMLGWRRGAYTLSGEFNWHFRSDWDLSVPTPSLQTVTNVFTNIERSSWLGGIERRWPIAERWQLAMGVRAGVGTNRFRTDYKERAVTVGGPAVIIKRSSRTGQFNWGVDLSVSRRVGKRWEYGLQYRYFDAGNMRIRPLPDRSIQFQTRLTEHLLRFTLRYRFAGSGRRSG